jgi:putative flavoprotein involved in K+ transport
MMTTTHTIIIGGGQAGLAMSRCLSELGIEHVVLERGKVAERWRTEAWDSLHLLSPNWMTRLPGFQYDGRDPDGFMSAADFTALLDHYAVSSKAPVLTDTAVQKVERSGAGFHVETTKGAFRSSAVVVATGYCDVPFVPNDSRALPASVTQITPSQYRRPQQLPPGGVVVVGASATGVQLADEIQRSGRQVTIAVGGHTRLPRSYRGRDIFWWLDRLGMLTQSIDDVHDIERSRNQPSLQLVGKSDHSSLDVGVLQALGVRVVGRLRGISGAHVSLADDLAATTAAADIKLAEILDKIDHLIMTTGLDVGAAEPFRPTWPLAFDTPEALNLYDERIETVVWATGYKRSYPWLHLPVLDAHGDIVQNAGITSEDGLYVVGMRFQRRRNSNFIDGVGDDARLIAERIAQSVMHARVA